ncbi:membrane protein [Microlunatus endophyticus]|uniref:Membrane protein n=1 Tax=Microlunatus endophyticus TaxID=1716077 RepID=A0A917S041_9ACTN|nr:Bax inhibitor-1/YccA family protein [Microlunatus endophyticus]GGL46242.1 membrane protein [Microlunatus endophyticus]
MLRSSNPVLSRRDAFTPAPAQGQSPFIGQQADQYAGQPFGYGQQYGQQYGQPSGQASYGVQAPPEGRMTFDDVITRTAITMAVLVAAAVVSWWSISAGLVPPAVMLPAMLLSALVGFITAFVVTVRHRVSPPLVLVYSAIQGVFIGMLSRLFESLYDGIVGQAVIGTFVAAGVTLAVYKIFNVRVTSTFRKVVIIATAGFAVTMLINLVFALFGIDLGLRGVGNFSALSVLFSAIGVTLAVLNLVLDFDYIERGVRMGAPASRSWLGAFGLTVTMVWLYVEILRILSYFRR